MSSRGESNQPTDPTPEQVVREALYESGLRYKHNHGGKAKDLVKAVAIFTEAASKGHPEAMFELGLCYLGGEGVEANREKALHWFKQAADKGQAEALLQMGELLSEGRGIDIVMAGPPKGMDGSVRLDGLLCARLFGAGVSTAILLERSAILIKKNSDEVLVLRKRVLSTNGDSSGELFELFFLNVGIELLGLSQPAFTSLTSVGLTTVREVISRTESELLQVRNFDKDLLDEFRSKLKEIWLDPWEVVRLRSEECVRSSGPRDRLATQIGPMKWFYRRRCDRIEQGPISAYGLEEMALRGQLCPSDLVRREDMTVLRHALQFEGLIPWWHVLKLSDQKGPFTSDEIVELIQNGELDEEDLLRRHDHSEWRNPGSISGVCEVFDPSTADFMIFTEENQLTASSNWYVLRHDEQVGPLTTGEVKEKVKSGELGPDDLVLHPDDPFCWKSLRSIPFFDDQRLLATFSLIQKNQARREASDQIESRATIFHPVTRLRAHQRGVSCIAFSHDGRCLATGSFDTTIRLWSTDSYECREVCINHEDTISLLSFSPDSQILASSSWDGTIRVWDVPTGRQRLCITGHDGPVNAVAFHPDGETIVSGSNDKTIRLWDMRTGREKKRIGVPHGPVEYVSLLSGGRCLLSTCPPRYLFLWDLETGRTLFGEPRQASGINCVAASPNMRHVAAGGNAFEFGIRLAPELQEETDQYDNSIRFERNPSCQGRINVWDLNPRFPIDPRFWTAHLDRIWSVKFSPDSKLIASASSDTTAKLWDVKTEELIGTFNGHESAVFDVTFSPDGKRLATASEDGWVFLWKLTKLPKVPPKVVSFVGWGYFGPLTLSSF